MYNRIAFRNLSKNKLRSGLCFLMISGAIVSMIVFRGYILKTLDIIEVTVVNSQYGHIQIAKNSYWDMSAPEKKDALMTNYQDYIAEIVKNNPEIESISPRLSTYGLMSTEQISDSSQIIGVDVATEKNLDKGMQITEGRMLKPGSSAEVILGGLLAQRLMVKSGDNITVVTNTVDNIINAIDLKVVGIFSSGIEEVDKITSFINIEDLHKLLQLQAAEILRASVKIPDYNNTVRDKINTLLQKEGIKARGWRELAELFRKVELFYNGQTFIMFSILMFIVVLGILNTISMSLNERIGEIGTLRSFGQSRISLFFQLMWESVILSLIGIVLGVMVSSVLIEIINNANIRTDIPGSSQPVKIEIGFYWNVVIQASLIILAVVNLCSGFLVYKYVRKNIVESLRHNI